jgi:hypothetical protein
MAPAMSSMSAQRTTIRVSDLIIVKRTLLIYLVVKSLVEWQDCIMQLLAHWDNEREISGQYWNTEMSSESDAALLTESQVSTLTAAWDMEERSVSYIHES